MSILILRRCLNFFRCWECIIISVIKWIVCITEMPVIGGCFAVSLTILPNVISPTKALGGIRLKDICRDSWKYQKTTRIYASWNIQPLMKSNVTTKTSLKYCFQVNCPCYWVDKHHSPLFRPLQIHYHICMYITVNTCMRSIDISAGIRHSIRHQTLENSMFPRQNSLANIRYM